MSSLLDPRNLASAALYLWLLWVLLAAQPWGIPLAWLRAAAGVPQVRWRGDSVGSVLPPSHVSQ